MDWSQVLVTFISSFMGFLFALLANRVITWYDGVLRIKRVTGNLNNEFRQIARGFAGSGAGQGKLYFDTPIWNSLVSTGDLLLLLKKDRVYYNQVFSIHYKIHAIEHPGVEQNDRLKLIQLLMDEIKELQ